MRQLPPVADRADIVANLRDLVDENDRPVFPADHQRACLLLFRLIQRRLRQPKMRWLLVALTGAIALAVFVWMLREKNFADVYGLALVLGGALGNIRDRVTLGYVIDYADLHFGSFRPFLIFNIADAAITIGVLIILARTLFSREKPEAEAETAPES